MLTLFMSCGSLDGTAHQRALVVSLCIRGYMCTHASVHLCVKGSATKTSCNLVAVSFAEGQKPD